MQPTRAAQTHELKTALRIVALTLGGMCLLLTLVSAVAVHPIGWQRIGEANALMQRVTHSQHDNCRFCGMSRGFRSIWQGDIAEAQRFNPLAPPLFTLMILGDIVGIIVAGQWLRSRQLATA